MEREWSGNPRRLSRADLAEIERLIFAVKGRERLSTVFTHLRFPNEARFCDRSAQLQSLPNVRGVLLCLRESGTPIASSSRALHRKEANVTTRSTVSFLLCASLLAVGNAWSTPIAIPNAGFEDPPTASFGRAINDWTILGDAGAWNINAMPLGFWTVPAPEGNQVATLVGVGVPGPGTLSQVVGLLAADTIYTFSGMVGHPIGFSSGTIYTAQLVAGGNILATTSGTGPEGSFIGFEVVFNSAGSPYLGMPLEVVLSSNQAQTAFDAIALNSDAAETAVPEPASIVLFSLGLGAVVRSRRRTQ